MWDTQDHVKGKKATGIITFCDKKETKLANVQWAGGAHQAYRIGADSAFDLSIKGIKITTCRTCCLPDFIYVSSVLDQSITSIHFNEATFRKGCYQCGCGLSNRVLMGQNMSLEDCQTSCNNDENCKGIEHWVGGTMSCYRCRVPHQTVLRHPNDSPLIEVPSVYVKGNNWSKKVSF